MISNLAEVYGFLLFQKGSKARDPISTLMACKGPFTHDKR
jgi:hypothetical protein